MSMTIKEIVLEKINAVGADGLCSNDCWCDKEDLFPCYIDRMQKCQLARAVCMKDHCKPEDCEDCDADCDGYAEACITDEKIYIPWVEEEPSP